MNNISIPISDAKLESLAAALRATRGLETGVDRVTPASPQPFVTISRQAGAGGRTLGRCLVDRLNERDVTGMRWTLWDDALVEKVCKEHAIAEEFVRIFEDVRHGWIKDFLHAIAAGNDNREPDDFKVYRRVAVTIRELANMGRVVIVGRGSTFITSGMPGGVHLRLVAPLEHRVRHMAARMNVSEPEAAKRVREIDHNRTAFYRQYWPDKKLEPESFALTLNTSAIASEQQMAQCVLPLIATAGRCKSGACGCKRNTVEATLQTTA